MFCVTKYLFFFFKITIINNAIISSNTHNNFYHKNPYLKQIKHMNKDINKYEKQWVKQAARKANLALKNEINLDLFHRNINYCIKNHIPISYENIIQIFKTSQFNPETNDNHTIKNVNKFLNVFFKFLINCHNKKIKKRIKYNIKYIEKELKLLTRRQKRITKSFFYIINENLTLLMKEKRHFNIINQIYMDHLDYNRRQFEHNQLMDQNNHTYLLLAWVIIGFITIEYSTIIIQRILGFFSYIYNFFLFIFRFN